VELYIHCRICLQGVRREDFKFNTLEFIDWKTRVLNKLKSGRTSKKWKCESIEWIEKLLDTGKNCHRNGGQLLTNKLK